MEARPKFRPDILVTETKERGQRSILLKDPVTEYYYRATPYEYRLLKKLDGTVTLDEAIEKLKSEGYYYSAEDARMIAAKVAEAGMLLGTRFGTSQFQKHLRDKLRGVKRQQMLGSLYFMFIPLINPDRFLDRTVGIFNKIANRWTALLMGGLFVGAVFLVILGAHRIESEYLYFFNLENLLYLWITVAVTKLVHEFAHAYAAKSYGLHVPQMGIAFLIFFPCLYCNTTQAWQLADRSQRIRISAAGILAEAALAIVCTYIWYFTRPGMINSLAFYLVVFSFGSTVLFNANPLMKWDGYFILMDYLGIPNLATKSFGYLKYLFMNRVLGISLVPNPASTTREMTIFLLYGSMAFLYRVFLYLGIVLGLYYRFDKLLAVVLGIIAVVLFLVRPLIRGGQSVYKMRAEIRPRFAGSMVFVLLVAAICGGLAVPVSTKSVYPCYLDSERTQKLTVPLKTAVKEVLIRDGMAVSNGRLLFTLDTSALTVALDKKEVEREIIAEKTKQMLLDDKQMARKAELDIQLQQVDHEVDRLRKDLAIARSGIVAPFSGVLTRVDSRLQEGYQPGDGVIVGELKSEKERVIKILVPEDDLYKLREGQPVEVWFPDRNGGALNAETISDVKPYSEEDLRDSPFSSRYGGEIATEAKDSERLDVPLEAQYVCSARTTVDRGIPLGTTGRCAVASSPRSVLSRTINAAMQAFNRESNL